MANAPAETESQQQRLQQLRQDIKSIRQSLEHSKQDKQRAEQQLRFTEVGISKINHLLLTLDKELQHQQTQLSSLNQKQDLLSKKLTTHTQAIAKHVNASYRLGRQAYLKLLLNQQNPQRVARTLRYYDFYNRARLEQIEMWLNDTASLRRTRTEISKQTEALKNLRQEQTTEQKQLSALHVQRAQALVAIKKQIYDKKQELDKLLQNERKLLELVQTITADGPVNTTMTLPLPGAAQKPFAQLKGQLAWPTRGRLTAKFGSSRDIGDLKWQGVFISAGTGQPVHAVSSGRIAYADWLKGFGLLVILDHGSGYMSLYGHNESLYKETGAWVEPNEVIATVGSSGGKYKSGLYFEVRHQGKPVNPVKWFK